MLSMLMDDEPAGLVGWYSALNDSRKAFVQVRKALAEIPLTEAQDLLLRSLGTLCKEEPVDPRLVGLVASLCPEASQDLAMRRRSLEVALGLATASPSAALTLISGFGVKAQDAAGEQLDGLREFGAELSRQEKWEHLVRYMMMFPRVAESSGLSANATIQRLVEARELHLAVSLAEGFNMTERARGLRRGMREAKVRESVERGNLIKGIYACGKNPFFRRLFLKLLLEEGMTHLAIHQAKAWEMPLKLNSKHWRRQKARREAHFRMPKAVPVEFVSSSEALPDAFEKLRGAQVVGLDTESHHQGGLTLLQLATDEHVFLVDVLALSGCAVLGGLLAKLLEDSGVTKLSFGGTQDVKMVYQLPCLRESKQALAAHVDVQRLAAEKRKEKSKEELSLKEAMHGLSLASLSRDVLGKPLNKEMTGSDWAFRPLSKAQTEYAALDAWILVRLFAKLTPPQREARLQEA